MSISTEKVCSCINMQDLKAFCCGNIIQFFEHPLSYRPKYHSELSLKSIINDLPADSSFRSSLTIEGKDLETTWLSRRIYVVALGGHIATRIRMFQSALWWCQSNFVLGIGHHGEIWHGWLASCTFLWNLGGGGGWRGTWEGRGWRHVPKLVCFQRKRQWALRWKFIPPTLCLCAPLKSFLHAPGVLSPQCEDHLDLYMGRFLTSFNFHFFHFRMRKIQRTDFIVLLCWLDRMRDVPGT